MSGSGKSSLAFDTIYAEGQRRLLASMSTFAKRFVGQLKKPDVDFVNGLSPVVSIDQKTVGSNPRSTVGTMTDISDYLRMLFATMGTAHCPLCGEALAIRTPHQMMEHLLSLPRGRFASRSRDALASRLGRHQNFELFALGAVEQELDVLFGQVLKGRIEAESVMGRQAVEHSAAPTVGAVAERGVDECALVQAAFGIGYEQRRMHPHRCSDARARRARAQRVVEGELGLVHFTGDKAMPGAAKTVVESLMPVAKLLGFRDVKTQ